MEDIKLATLLTDKFREEILQPDDKRGYFKLDWLINAIIELFEKYPEVKDKIKFEDLSINEIIKEIENYFSKLQAKRKLNLNATRLFLYQSTHTRKSESLLLWLVLGFSFFNAFLRMSNNQKRAGQTLDAEPEFDEYISAFDDDELVLDKQSDDGQVIELIQLIENQDVPGELIDSEIMTLKASYEHKSRLSISNSKK